MSLYNNRLPFMPLFAAALMALFALVCLWQSPGAVRGKLDAAETERYLGMLDAQLPLPPQERARILQRMRAFAEADDGRPFYMLNVMRYYERVREISGTPAFDGTPRAANEHYEERVRALLFERGGFPAVAGQAAGRDLFGHDGADVDRVLLVRYPSRRAFFDLVTDPRYLPLAPYKLMALDVVLIPVAPEVAIPDLRIVAGAVLLFAFLVVGWWRARSPLPVGGRECVAGSIVR